jgi:hypothetical protein
VTWDRWRRRHVITSLDGDLGQTEAEARYYKARLPTDVAARPQVLMYLDSGRVISGFRCVPINTEVEVC